jgi:hypothetical protein
MIRRPPASLQWGALLGVLVCAFASFEAGACSSSSTPLKIPSDAQRTAEFCAARATYKLAALAAQGALDPAPGSPRARFEAAEDAFCAPTGDAGK